jgi:hypothetical protein
MNRRNFVEEYRNPSKRIAPSGVALGSRAVTVHHTTPIISSKIPGWLKSPDLRLNRRSMNLKLKRTKRAVGLVTGDPALFGSDG